MNDGLAVDRLSVDRGGRPVLRDLSFAVQPGTALAITGNNGAGKSTLLRAIAGFLPTLAGNVTLRLPRPDRPGRFDDAAKHDDVGEHTSYLGHGSSLKSSLTAVENLRFMAAWAGAADTAPIDALAAVGLGHLADFPVCILSAGQRRRVALAGLLVAGRPLWLLDEPATALDAAAEAMLAGLLRSHLAGGGIVLAAVHGPLGLSVRELHLGSA